MPLPEPVPEPLEAVHKALPGASDAELAARACRRDDLAFELIMRRYNRRLFRLVRSLLRNDAEAEDVLQETYLRAYARLGDLKDGQALAAWLARIAANEALGRLRVATRVISLDEQRARRRGKEEDDDGELSHDPASDQPGPERLAASSELRRLLEAAVDALPQEFRTVFVLREVEGLSTAETAACLELRPETVKTRLHRARRLLQEALGEQLLALSPSLFEFDGGRCDRIVARVLARLPASPATPDLTAATAPTETTRSWPRWVAQLAALLERRRKR